MKYFDMVVAAVDFIEKHLTENISVKDVAQLTGLSPWHFQRIFHEAIGETIGSYLRRRRLAQALEALKKKDQKIIDIALDFQFSSPEAFSRSFKTEFGMSPQHYQHSNAPILSFKKPSLSAKQINYIINDINLVPEIRLIDPIPVIGLPASFVSPLLHRHEYLEQVSLVWNMFKSREHEIPGANNKIKIGLIEGLSSNLHHVHDDLMDYLACAPALTGKEKNSPPGFRSAVIPGGQYAVFKATGYHEQTQFIIDYVYSTWLPNSRYRRSHGPEFTWLDHSHQALDPRSSQVEYYLPVDQADVIK